MAVKQFAVYLICFLLLLVPLIALLIWSTLSFHTNRMWWTVFPCERHLNVVQIFTFTNTSSSCWKTVERFVTDILCRHVEIFFSHLCGKCLKFYSMYSFQVTPEDLLPVTLCTSCIYKLEICHEFVHGCLDADAKLRTILGLKVDHNVSQHMFELCHNIIGAFLP